MDKHINREETLKTVAYEHTRVLTNDSDINEQMGGYNASSFIAGYLAAVTTIQHKLDALPSADVELVVHAKWETVEREGFWTDQMAESLLTGRPTKRAMPICSRCMTEFGTIALKYKRCPECGAIMDIE